MRRLLAAEAFVLEEGFEGEVAAHNVVDQERDHVAVTFLQFVPVIQILAGGFHSGRAVHKIDVVFGVRSQIGVAKLAQDRFLAMEIDADEGGEILHRIMTAVIAGG